ncbi:hypothetical protein BCF11_5207 [Collimonas sp. PA-H2]|uniref:hypothetical protein n=1 Tax=Collimonas sp. PA-H2 TaxID=1881062 RepID=UPI000BF538E0|nr:hypothetical protein [Collimonas sp. PA-H2]PFH04428.1 hypothetical protein BCF11_5207 [Collimonas sp. PA-H2]
MKKLLLFVGWVLFTSATTAHAQEKSYIVGDELSQFVSQPVSVIRAQDQMSFRFQFKSDSTAYLNVGIGISGTIIKNYSGTWKLNPKQTLVCTTWNSVDIKNWCFGYYHEGDGVKMYTYGGPNNPHVEFGTVK